MTADKRARSPHQPTGQWIRPAKRLAIYLRDGFRCIYCCRDMRDADPRDLTLDHIACRADGGGNGEGNLVTACRSCNCSRRDRSLESFAGPETISDVARLTARDLRPYLTMAKALIAGKTGGEEC
jgi:hypothetical protein